MENGTCRSRQETCSAAEPVESAHKSRRTWQMLQQYLRMEAVGWRLDQGGLRSAPSCTDVSGVEIADKEDRAWFQGPNM